ncbi:MAG: DUF692 family multinuclear iron-containing protein [Kofleriaceae bacterium]
MRDGLIHTGFSLFATEAQRLAALPLLEAGVVDAIEWTLDHGWGQTLPAWVTALLDAYAAEGRLYGHGVHYSPCSLRADATGWLARAAAEVGARRYRHVTEHWGCSRAGVLARGAPMPVPACEAAVEHTVSSLAALAEAVTVPVGLENLALAFGPADVDAQPVMLARVLDAIDGVLLLDLHNLWCQAVNYGRDVHALAARYPLARVRQLHVAGGSWSASAIGGPFRRDTHDALVPDEVMQLVAWIIPRCPALECVILERLPDTFPDEPAREAWRTQWLALAAIVEQAARAPMIATPPPPWCALDPRPSLADLGRYQDALAGVVRATSNARDVHAALLAHPEVAPFRDHVAGFELRALEVAIALANKWGIVHPDP